MSFLSFYMRCLIRKMKQTPQFKTGIGKGDFKLVIMSLNNRLMEPVVPVPVKNTPYFIIIQFRLFSDFFGALDNGLGVRPTAFIASQNFNPIL